MKDRNKFKKIHQIDAEQFINQFFLRNCALEPAIPKIADFILDLKYTIIILEKKLAKKKFNNPNPEAL